MDSKLSMIVAENIQLWSYNPRIWYSLHSFNDNLRKCLSGFLADLGAKMLRKRYSSVQHATLIIKSGDHV